MSIYSPHVSESNQLISSVRALQLLTDGILPTDSLIRSFVVMETVHSMEPTFDVPIVNVTVVRGQIALLPCSIDFLGKYKVRI